MIGFSRPASPAALLITARPALPWQRRCAHVGSAAPRRSVMLVQPRAICGTVGSAHLGFFLKLSFLFQFLVINEHFSLLKIILDYEAKPALSRNFIGETLKYPQLLYSYKLFHCCYERLEYLDVIISSKSRR